MPLKQYLTTSIHLVTNTGWLLSSEVVAKASRLLVIFTLAATLPIIEYGTVMLALGCHEVFKLVMRSGAGSQIIQCRDEQLKGFAENGLILQWIISIGLTLIQCASAFFIGHFYENTQLTYLLCGMAGVYLLYPIVSIRVLLLQRANNMRFYSVRNALCITAENASIALFVVLDQGIWSVVYGKWVFAIVWLALFSLSPKNPFGFSVNLKVLKHLLLTSGRLLMTEVTRAFRNQADVLIGAKLLSPELFGIYSFAKTAGVNLGMSLSTAFNTALYPFLCDKNRQSGQNNQSKTILIMSTSVALMFVIQALLVSVYVPLLFVQSWQQEYTTISLLCLANVPLIYIDAYCNSLRSTAKFSSEFNVRVITLLVLIGGLALLSPNHFQTYANCILVVNVLSLCVFLLPIFKRFNESTNLLKRSH